MQISSGSGFYINRQGYLITNAHVLQDCSSINVHGDTTQSEARLIARDDRHDLALLHTSARPSHIAPLRYHEHLRAGDPVVVIGYPGEYGVRRQHLMVWAEVMDAVGPNGEPHWIQFSDSTAKGNSGGPLLDVNGNVIGVVTAKITTLTAEGIPIGRSDVAVSIPILKDFLDSNFVSYDQLFTFVPLTNETIEQKASKFVVNVHCVQRNMF